MIHIEVDSDPSKGTLTLKSNVSAEASVQVLHQAYLKALIDSLVAAVAAQSRRIISPLDN